MFLTSVQSILRPWSLIGVIIELIGLAAGYGLVAGSVLHLHRNRPADPMALMWRQIFLLALTAIVAAALILVFLGRTNGLRTPLRWCARWLCVQPNIANETAALAIQVPTDTKNHEIESQV